METKKRLIDANALKEKAEPEEVTGEGIVYVQDIDEAPTVDAVEVVRCKDCAWCHKYEDLNYCENPHTPWIDEPDFDDVTVADNDFCSYGERKDNA